jgi:hypothetical protein
MSKTHHKVRVITPANAPDIDKIINWHDSSDRKWLNNHLHHCMLNQKLVTLSPCLVQPLDDESN